MAESFPYKTLEQGQINYVLSLCGDQQTKELESIREFLRCNGLPLTSRFPLKKALENINLKLMPDDDNGSLARRSVVFNRGVLLYAALVHIATGIVELPVEPQAINDVYMRAHEDPDSFQFESFACAAEIPSFQAIFERLAPPLVEPETLEPRIALVGAGVLHLITTESVGLSRYTSELTYPELQEDPEIDAMLADTLRSFYDDLGFNG